MLILVGNKCEIFLDFGENCSRFFKNLNINTNLAITFRDNREIHGSLRK